jgi:hypothetical protein
METELGPPVNKRVFTSRVKEVHVAGDLHGDYDMFRRIIKRHERPGKGPLLLFLGDYADRGPRGVEIIDELNSLLDEREDIVALKGNHELYQDGSPQFFPCELISEAEQKHGSWKAFCNDIFSAFLDRLYIAAIINRVLFIHAGIFSGIRSRADLADRKNETNLLWSDPSPVRGEHMSRRGAGVEFGEDVTAKVLSSLGLELIVRSHEPMKAAHGPYEEHGKRVITVNSCATYGEPWKPFLMKINTETLVREALFL